MSNTRYLVRNTETEDTEIWDLTKEQSRFLDTLIDNDFFSDWYYQITKMEDEEIEVRTF
jgi:hypothetical protein